MNETLTLWTGLALVGGGFLAGLAVARLAWGGRRQLVRHLLAEGDGRRQAETEALLDGVKMAFGDISLEAMRRAGDDLMRHMQAAAGAERRLQGLQLGAERSEFESRIGAVMAQIERMQTLVRELERDRALKFGELTSQLKRAGDSAAALGQTTSLLREALANSRARGQWGERMAEDVLRLAGLIENVNFRRQETQPDGGRPDYTLLLPRGRMLHMDVKFPFDNYVKSLGAGDDAARARHEAAFVRDARARIAEVAGRGYIRPEEGTLDYALLFVPNEQVFAAMVQLAPDLLDEALRKRVVPCSPFTLFAVLAVIREAVEHFAVEQAARELLDSFASFRRQWRAYTAEADKVGRKLDEAVTAYRDLAQSRTVKLDRELDRLEALRQRREETAPSPITEEAAAKDNAPS